MGASPILTILKNGEAIKSCPIEGEAVVGRSEGCLIRLEDRAISRQHVVFRQTAEGIQVEKKSEFAPLIVNGKDCTRAILKEGDTIALGPYILRLSTPSAPAPVARPSLQQVDSPQLSQLTREIPELAAPEASPDVVAGVGLHLDEVPGVVEADSPSAPADPVGEAFQLQEPAEAMGQGQASEAHEIDALPDINLDAPFAGAAAATPEIIVADPADDDARTKLTPQAKLSVKLVFMPGAANVEEYEITRDEISIGRGKSCDVVINDKKSSRKNCIIRKAGLSFIIKDLESANGTFVNGMKVDERELAGGDKIQIGETEFVFQAKSLEYMEQEKDIVSLQALEAEHPSEEAIPELASMSAPEAAPFAQPDTSLGSASQISLQSLGRIGASGDEGSGVGLGGITGIVGVGGAKGKASLLEKYRALPPARRMLVTIALLGVMYFAFLDEDTPSKKPQPKPSPKVSSSVADSGGRTFERLSPEQQRFVESQHQLAFSHFQNQEFDKSLFELKKIFELVEDYKDSRDMERYAIEGKRKLEAIQEEKRRKEEEARLKAKIAQLVDEARTRMTEKQYEQARELFVQILSIDPDNAQVAAWRKELEEYEEQRRLRAQEAEVRKQINEHAWIEYKSAVALQKSGKFYAAITAFGKIVNMDASDKRVGAAARKGIQECRARVAELRDPVLQEAKQLEEAGEVSKAFQAYLRASAIDPRDPTSKEGMNRLRGVLHQRAKAMYTEAILAESYSDFDFARKKFHECLETAPPDDVYHDRARRKLANYFKKEDPH